jgi:hypothetical protein
MFDRLIWIVTGACGLVFGGWWLAGGGELWVGLVFLLYGVGACLWGIRRGREF